MDVFMVWACCVGVLCLCRGEDQQLPGPIHGVDHTDLERGLSHPLLELLCVPWCMQRLYEAQQPCSYVKLHAQAGSGTRMFPVPLHSGAYLPSARYSSYERHMEVLMHLSANSD